jgi:hypothetical protein
MPKKRSDQDWQSGATRLLGSKKQLRAYPSRQKNASFSRLEPAYWDRLLRHF